MKVEKVHCWTHIGCFLFQFAIKLPRINRTFGFSMLTLSRERKNDYVGSCIRSDGERKRTQIERERERDRRAAAKQTEIGKKS